LKWRCPAVIPSQSLGSADDPAMQDCEEPMYPGTLVQKVEAKHHQDAAPADEQYENDGKKQPEYYEEDASEYHFGPANEKWVFRD
jgi:hypothetical protein